MEVPMAKVFDRSPPRPSSSRYLPDLVAKDGKQLSLGNLNMQLTGAANKVPAIDNLSSPNAISSSLSHSPLHVFVPSIAPSPTLGSTSCELSKGEATISEKRLRRAISNRESARRLWMRRKKLIEELQSKVNQLQTVNNLLCEKVISLLECKQATFYENSQLRNRVALLQNVVGETSNAKDGYGASNPIGGAT